MSDDLIDAIEAAEAEAATQEIMSTRASEAIERYAKMAERAQTEMRGERRIDAAKRYAKAREALAPRELAILDMTALKRRSLHDLAQKTGTTVLSLTQLLAQAGERLADHFDGPRAP